MKPELANFLNVIGWSAVVAIVIFFVTRMFWLWYFKLDKIEAHLASISSTLKSMKQQAAAPDASMKKVSDEKYWPK